MVSSVGSSENAVAVDPSEQRQRSDGIDGQNDESARAELLATLDVEAEEDKEAANTL